MSIHIRILQPTICQFRFSIKFCGWCYPCSFIGTSCHALGGERRGVGAGRRRRLIIDRVKQIHEADLREQISGGPYRDNLMNEKGRDQFDQMLSNVKYGPEHQIRFDKGTKKSKFFASRTRSSEPVRINGFRGHVFSRLGENAPGANFFDFTGNDENGGWHQDMPAGQVWTLNQFSTSLSLLP